MNPAIGVLGAVLIAIGGTFISLSLYQFFADALRNTNGPNPGGVVSAFIGFLTFGLGLWFIVQSRQNQTQQAPIVQ